MVQSRPLLLVALVALAGCTTFQGEEGESTPNGSLSVSIANEHDQSYEVRITVVPTGVDGVTVTYANGTDRTFDVSSLTEVPDRALGNATAVGTVGGDEFSKSYVVGPNEGFGATVEDASAAGSVVYDVRPVEGAGTHRGLGIVNCRSERGTTDLAITIRSDGSLHALVTCGPHAT